MEEKRKYKRIKRSFLSWFRTIKIVLAKRRPSKWDIVSARDLSAGGMLFNYNNRIKMGTQVNFRIIFPFSAHIIRCIGRVIRNKRPRENSYSKLFLVATEFEKIKQKDKELINRVADELC